MMPEKLQIESKVLRLKKLLEEYHQHSDEETRAGFRKELTAELIVRLFEEPEPHEKKKD